MERVDRGVAPPVKAATFIGQRKTEDTAEDRPDVVVDPSKNKFGLHQGRDLLKEFTDTRHACLSGRQGHGHVTFEGERRK